MNTERSAETLRLARLILASADDQDTGWAAQELAKLVLADDKRERRPFVESEDGSRSTCPDDCHHAHDEEEGSK